VYLVALSKSHFVSDVGYHADVPDKFWSIGKRVPHWVSLITAVC